MSGSNGQRKSGKGGRASAREVVLALSGALLAASLVLAGCGTKDDAKASAPPPATPVEVRVVLNERVPDTTEYLSVLKSRHSAAIQPQVEGQITSILVKSGDRVQAGEALLQIDPLKQEAAVSSLESAKAAQDANVQLAKVSYERAKKLSEAGVISKQEFDSAQSNYDASMAQLKAVSDQVAEQKVQLHYYRVSAPMNGIVGDIPVHVGDRVGVSTLLTTVDEPGALEAYIYVPVERSRALKLGLPVKLLDSDGKVLTDTRITFVSPQVDTDTQTVLAKAAVANSAANFRIAQQVRAQVTWGVHDGAVVPILAVSRINGQFFAFLSVNEGKGTVARQKLLKLGDTSGNNFVVNEGAKAGDHIIVSGTQFLQDGAPVSEQIQGSSSGAGQTNGKPSTPAAH